MSQFLAQRSSTQDTRDMHAVTNSCGSVHGVLHDNSSVHVNSCGALGHRHSCNLHAAVVQGGTKALSMSTRLRVGRPAVVKLASPQQAPGRLHEETWAVFYRNRRRWKSFRGVLLLWLALHILITLLSHLGQAE